MSIKCPEFGVMGQYEFFLNGEPVFKTPSKNLITDFGWTRIANLTAAAVAGSQIQVGSGNVPPATTDTSLGSLLAQLGGPATCTVATGNDAGGDFSSSAISYVFATGAIIGNVAEVGFKIASGDSGLTSRSLVKDGLGNPAVIVCTSIDQLTVIYTLKYYRSSIDTPTVLTIGGVSTTCTARTAPMIPGTSNNNGNIGGLSLVEWSQFDLFGTGSSLGAPGSSVSGAGTVPSGIGVTGKSITVNPTNITVAFSSTVIPVGQGNVSGGVFNMQFTPAVGNGLGGYGALKMGFSPAIAKNNTKTLQFSWLCTFNRL